MKKNFLKKTKEIIIKNYSILDRKYISPTILKKSIKITNLSMMTGHFLFDMPYEKLLEVNNKLVSFESHIYVWDYLMEDNQKVKKTAEENFKEIINDTFSLLKELEVSNENTIKYVNYLVEYMNIENRIMSDYNAKIQFEDFYRAWYLRSSDIRILLEMIYFSNTGKSIPQEYFEWIDPFFKLFEVSDDIKTYEKDLKNNDWNTYQIYIKIFGKEEGKKRLEEEMNLQRNRMIAFQSKNQHLSHNLTSFSNSYLYNLEKLPFPLN
jgi:hypothetical protein